MPLSTNGPGIRSPPALSTGAPHPPTTTIPTTTPASTRIALVLTMDDPVLVARLARRIRSTFPELAIIARARDTAHAAKLYEAGVTDAVPEALEASLQLSEAVLVDIGVAMGPVIASIHEKRSELRAEIMAQAELEAEPRLGRRRVRDSAPAGQR